MTYTRLLRATPLQTRFLDPRASNDFNPYPQCSSPLLSIPKNNRLLALSLLSLVHKIARIYSRSYRQLINARSLPSLSPAHGREANLGRRLSPSLSLSRQPPACGRPPILE